MKDGVGEPFASVQAGYEPYEPAAGCESHSQQTRVDAGGIGRSIGIVTTLLI